MKLKQTHQILPAAAADAPEITALERECFSRPWNENSVRTEIENPDVCFLICRIEHVLCGYISARFTCGEWYLGNLAVSPEFRRQGIAKLLLLSLIEHAEQKHASFVSLEVRKSNLPAIQLYENCGFQCVGLRKNFYSAPTEDAAIYTLFLNGSDNFT